MSEPIFAVVPFEVLKDSSLSQVDRFIFAILCGFANTKTGECFPSIHLIAELAGVVDKTVQRSISRLVDAGHIKREFRTREDGGSTSNAYTVVWWLEHESGGGDSGDSGGGDSAVTPRTTKKRTDQLTRKKAPRSATYLQEEEVFEFWLETMGRDRRTSFDSNSRRSHVRARLTEGFTVDDLKLAIWGCKLNPWNQGENPTGTTYDDLELICRNETKVRNFMRCAMKLGNSGEIARIREVQEILQLSGENAAMALAEQYGIAWRDVVGREDLPRELTLVEE